MWSDRTQNCFKIIKFRWSIVTIFALNAFIRAKGRRELLENKVRPWYLALITMMAKRVFLKMGLDLLAKKTSYFKPRGSSLVLPSFVTFDQRKIYWQIFGKSLIEEMHDNTPMVCLIFVYLFQMNIMRILLNVFKYHWYGSPHFLLLKYFIDYKLIQFVLDCVQ